MSRRPPFSFQNTRRKVGHFSKAEHVVVQIGGRGIAEFRSNPGQDSKNSPRSSHPSPQKGCIHSKFYISRFVHLTCGDRVAPLKITEPYRWWREKHLDRALVFSVVFHKCPLATGKADLE